jgi:hypothetical protein
MVAELVGDHVGLCKITRRAEACCELIEEPEVDVDPFVAGAVERSARRLAEAAGGYVRAVVTDSQGRKAWIQPVRVF